MMLKMQNFTISVLLLPLWVNHKYTFNIVLLQYVLPATGFK